MKIDDIKMLYEKAICIYSYAEVEAALTKMAALINKRLEDTNPIILAIMNGGLVTCGHLLTRLHFPLEVDYIHATRYEGKTQGADLQWYKKPTLQLAGRTILLVDDILDGGVTLAEIVAYCKEQGAAAVYTAVLVDKYQKRIPTGLHNADFVGLKIEDHFVFGFGMDYNGYWRNAPGIYYLPT